MALHLCLVFIFVVRVPAIPVEEGGDSLMKLSQEPQILASRVSPSELSFNQQTQQINLSKFSSTEGMFF